MRSAALVSTSGKIDFFCFPEFDSPTVFASLLDTDQAGSFRLHPEGEGFTTKHLYIPGTNVLLTRFLSNNALAELSDFMPLPANGSPHSIMRRIVVLEGEVYFSLCCLPAFDYARASHTTQPQSGGVLFIPQSDTCPPMLLESSVPLEIKGLSANASFRLKKGEQAAFIFGRFNPDATVSDVAAFVKAQLDATCNWWERWTAKSTYRGRWREQVTRSALALKLLTSEEHGSLIAAPTFGLPEELGGERNWDYRYTWLRDASFSIYALTRLGYVEEGRRFTGWLKDRMNWESAEGPLQTMYRQDGGTDLPEVELGNLSGYKNSRPVRIGNGAVHQLQLDIYGELFDAIYLSSKYGDGIPYEGWIRLKRILRWLADHWQDPDEGIWEVRGGRREFLHSRIMCWVAFDRVIRLGEKRSLSGPFDWMEDCRDAIVADIHENFWSEELGAFVQYKGATDVDASALLMPLVRFISPADPRWLSTLAKIERDLTIDVFVKRYASQTRVDGLKGSEGCFVACSFWLVEALARSHQVDKAHRLFEKLLSHMNELGLYSEELSSTGELLGNFPQALTHLAFISAATYLDRRLQSGPPEPWS